jgi:hypothetical protein
MFDINTVINTAIANAVNEATQPLVEHIVRLQERLAALENNPAIGIDTALAERVAKLENTPVVIDEAKMVEALNTQEWFWEKLSRKVKGIAEDAAEAAIEDHCQNYDHDDYDNVSRAVEELDLDDIVSRDGLQDTVKELLNDASIDVRFSF